MTKIPSTTLGFIIFGTALVFVVMFFFYPQWKTTRTITHKTPRARPASIIFDSRYGVCKLQSVERLSNNSFKAELYSDSGTYYTKYYDDEIEPYSKFQVVAGSASPVFITKSDKAVLEGEDTTKIDELQRLRNELELTKTRQRIQINDPDEKVSRVINWLSQLKTAESRGVVKSA